MAGPGLLPNVMTATTIDGMFYNLPKDNSIKHRTSASKIPDTPLNSSPIFSISLPPTTNEYYFLESFHLQGAFKVVKIKKEDGTETPLADDDDVSIVSNMPQALFKLITLHANEELVSDMSGHYYAYKAYLETKFSHEKDNVFLKAEQAWIPDTLGKENALDKTGGNEGYVKRAKLIKKSAEVPFVIPLHVDFLRIKHLLINGVGLRFTFHLADPDQHLLSSTFQAKSGTTHSLAIRFTQLSLHYDKFELRPEVTRQHAERLTREPLDYEFHHRKITSYEIPAKHQGTITTSLARGSLPHVLLVWMVQNEKLNGLGNNPLTFHHQNVNRVYFSLDDRVITPMYEGLDWTSVKSILPLYHDVVKGLKLNHPSMTVPFTIEEYMQNGTFFFLNVDACPCLMAHNHESQKGELFITLEFKDPIPNSLKLFTYGVYDGLVQIDRERNVLARAV